MNSKLPICVLIVQLLEWTPVESVSLSYYYKKENEVFKPVCENKDEYTVAEGDEVAVYLKKREPLAFAQCTLQHNASFITVDQFIIIGESNVYQGKLKYVMEEPYICSFYILKQQGTNIEPTSVFNNIAYVQITCTFKLKIYREKPRLLTVLVNLERQIPSRKSIDNVVRSKYKYNKNEKLLVTCEKKPSTKGNVELVIPGIRNTVDVSTLPLSRAEFQLNYIPVMGTYFQLKCYLHEGNNTTELYAIDFAPNRCLHEIDVDGLSVNNIIENKDDNKFLYYKYTDIEEVKLKCSMACLNEYCQMEMWYNAIKVNYSQWIYNTAVDVSHMLILMPTDNGAVVKCVGFYKPAAEVLIQTVHITLQHANGESNEAATTLRTNECLNGDNTINTDANCTNNRQYSISTSTRKPVPITSPTTWPPTSPTTRPPTSPTTWSTTWPTTWPTTSPRTTPTISPQPSTQNRFPKSIIWSMGCVLLVVVVLVLVWYLACARRKSQRPQLPLPQPEDSNTSPSTSQNQEQPEYEEIPDVICHPGLDQRRQLRRIPDMRLDPQNGRLIVKGKAINLQKLLQEAEYVDTK